MPSFAIFGVPLRDRNGFKFLPVSLAKNKPPGFINEDDDVNANEFRKQLGQFELALTKQDGQASQRRTQRKKPVILISGTC
jgi:hypothetical protein